MKDEKEFVIVIGEERETEFYGFVKISCSPKPDALVGVTFSSLLSFIDADTIEKGELDLRALYDGHKVPAFLIEDKSITLDKFLECTILVEELADVLTEGSKNQK